MVVEEGVRVREKECLTNGEGAEGAREIIPRELGSTHI